MVHLLHLDAISPYMNGSGGTLAHLGVLVALVLSVVT